MRLLRAVSSFLRMIAISRIAMLGAILTTTAVFAEFLLVVGELFFFESHPYIGIVSFVLLPGLFVTGLVLIPIGLLLRLRKAKAGFSLGAIERVAARRGIMLPQVIQVILTLSLINLVILALVGYRGFHYTESVAFCGTVCHEVMHPEYETYSRSPHSEVACVQCHIGPGAKWFVKSKLSGARQLWAVVANTYSRPIETPVHNLRPAREVCEVCHRPDFFHGNLMRVIQHFEPNEDNTRTYSVLNMRVGSGDATGRAAHGIHWHVSRQQQVRYYATDRRREEIVWVEEVRKDGTRRVWTDPENPVEPPPDAELRVMDCVDCHNRPTHIYLSPDQALDEWMSTDRLDPTIPWIRAIAYEVLTPVYDTTEAAMAAIARMPDLYRERHPEQWAANENRVREAVAAVQKIYRSYVFPDMRIQWNTYNSLVGHPTPYTQACFRCHNGVLRNEADEAITLDCTSCHYILANREPNPSILQRLTTR